MRDDIEISAVHNANDIRKILIYFDKVFNPRISERIKDLEKYSLKLYKNAIVMIAKKSDEAIGFFALYANDYKSKIAYLTQIAILPEYQGCGIGKLLLDECIKNAVNRGMDKIRLEVLDTNIQAISFYQRNAFILEGNSKNHSFINMVRNLY